MDSDITNLFPTEDHPSPPPVVPQQDEKPADEEDTTPLENVIHTDSSFYNQQPMLYYPPPPHPMYPTISNNGKQEVKWDPFSAIGVTSWFVIAIAFMMGFLIGKLR